jgi:hypothetical protein
MNQRHVALVMGIYTIAALAVAGCESKNPDVVVTPPSTTVVHDPSPNAPNVVVTPPSSTHTDVHTNTTTPPGGTGSTTTTTSTGGR